MNEQNNIKLVKQIYDCFLNKDIQGILNNLSENIEWKEPPHGPSPFAGVYNGRNQVGDFFKKMSETGNMISFEPREFFAEGNTVVVLGNYKFHSINTSKDWETDFAMVWRVENNKVSRFQIFKDSAAELIALQKELVH